VSKPSVPNPLVKADPELVERLTAFKLHVYDMLINKLAAKTAPELGFRTDQCTQPLEDMTATAQVLFVLTRQSWDRDDLTILDTYWRQASHSTLFGEEFEAERHRIRHQVQAGHQQVLALEEKEQNTFGFPC
jgi:hypothetical protein